MRTVQNLAKVIIGLSIAGFMQTHIEQVCAAEISDGVKLNMNKALSSRNCVGCDLENADFTRMDLSGVNLEGADLRNASFALADLTKANLKNCNLNGARFGGADLSGCDLRGAVFGKSTLSGAYIASALIDADRVEGKHTPGIEKRTVLPDAVVIEGSEKKKTDKPAAPEEMSEVLPAMDQSDTEKVVAKKVRPKQERVTTAKTKHAVSPKQLVVEHSRQTDEQDAEIEALEQKQNVTKVATVIPDPVIKKSPSAKALQHKQSATSDIVPAKVAVPAQQVDKEVMQKDTIEPPSSVSREKTDLAQKMFKNKRCYKCDLMGMNLSNADMAKFDLEGSNLANCNLQSADLEEANLKGVSFIGANLKEADLRGADLYKADLSGADLSGAKLKGALVDGAVLTGVIGYKPAE